MAESLTKLVEVLFSDKSDSKSLSSSDLLHRLRSSDDSIRPGLEKLFLILKHGVEPVEDGKLGLQSWNDSQIQAVCSLASAIASASRSLSGTSLHFFLFFFLVIKFAFYTFVLNFQLFGIFVLFLCYFYWFRSFRKCFLDSKQEVLNWK